MAFGNDRKHCVSFLFRSVGISSKQLAERRMTMSDLIVILILILFMSVVQFIAILLVRRFESFCNRIKAKLISFHRAPELEREKPVKKTSTVTMEDISADVPPLDDI